MANSQPTTRFLFLDGLRGWAALMVMLLHVFFGSLPPVDLWTDLGMKYWFSLGGEFMVGLFFVVSGFALSNAFIATEDRRLLVRIAGGRYLRLFIPIFATCLAVTLLLITGLIPEPSSRLEAYRTHYNFDPSVLNLLRFSTFDVFFRYDSATTYAGPLWTMAYELIGSYALLLMLFLSPGRRSRTILGLAITAYLMWAGSFYALFFWGALVAEAYLFIRSVNELGNRALITLSSIALVVGYLWPKLDTYSGIALLIEVSVVFVGVVFTPMARAFFESPLSRKLGEISFPLYLVHEAVIVAVGAPIYMASDSALVHWVAGIFAAVASTIAAIAFLPFEVASKKASAYAGDFLANAMQPLLRGAIRQN